MDQKPWYEKHQLDTAFPFRIYDFGLPNYPFHWHELLEIIYIVNGTISLSIEGRSYKPRQGDIVIINSGLIHGFYDASPGFSCIIMQSGLELFDQTLIDLRDRVFQKLVFGRKMFITADNDGDVHRRLVELLLSIRKEFFEKEEGYRLAIKSKLYELALVFLREVPVKQPLPRETAKRNYNHQILERIFSYIHSSYSNPAITLEKAASAAAMSKFYFTRFFKEQTGQTFHAYLSKLRVSHAEEFLTDSDMSITDIAYLCGFASPKTFNRLFRTYAGTTPSAYRSGTK
ncbi:AraC family transcriptional regulator [Spirochaetia bacterium]|nr:AraC family transcriptional regulator [Spirochaetia bacterium]